MGLGLLCVLGLSIPSVLGKESFEQARHGKFTTLSTKYGLMSCRNGVAEIGGGGKSGEASLRMFGGQDAELKLEGYAFQGSPAFCLGGAMDRAGPF